MIRETHCVSYYGRIYKTIPREDEGPAITEPDNSYICASALLATLNALYDDGEELDIFIGDSHVEVEKCVQNDTTDGPIITACFQNISDDDSPTFHVCDVHGPAGEWNDWNRDASIFQILENDIIQMFMDAAKDIPDEVTLYFGFSKFPNK